MFGIHGSDSEVGKYIKDYAQTANDVINSLRNKVLSPYASHIEMTNEIETTTDPVELLLIIFNGHGAMHIIDKINPFQVRARNL